MPIAIVLIFAVVVLAIFLIGILWSLVFLLPYYVCVGVAIFLLWMVDRRQRELAESVERETQRQRLLNEQEANAWRSSLEKDRKNISKRDKILRSIERSRDPPRDPQI